MRAEPELITSTRPQDYHLHYGLKHAPFGRQTDAALFVLSAAHEEALDKLYRGLVAGKSITLVTGAPGTGKSLLLQTLQTLFAERFDCFHVHTTDLQPAPAKPDVLMSTLLLRAAGVKGRVQGSDNAELRNYLTKARTDGRRMVVIIDDAHELTDTQLEELRHWSNLNDHTGTSLQFMLAGQDRLSERLNRPTLLNLKQRIGSRARLPALTLNETQHYLAHRCRLAGAPRTLFSQTMVIRIYSLTRGLPRLINTVADALLLQAYLRGSRSVGLEDVRLVSRDFDLDYAPIIPRPKKPERKSPTDFENDLTDTETGV